MPSSAPHPARRAALAAAALALSALVPVAYAQADRPLDVPFVPTAEDTVDRMLRMANVTAKDYVVDLGSGDGRIVITAARQFGARGFGVELNAERWKLSVRNAEKEGVADRAQFFQRDLFETDFSKATVLTMYLLPAVNLKLRPRILAELRPGTRVVSHDFDMGEWQPDARADRGWTRVYLWIVPAPVEGAWVWKHPVGGQTVDFAAELRQQFQVIHGSARIGVHNQWLQDARLRGADIAFTVIGEWNRERVLHEYSGVVSGDSITGKVRVIAPDGSATSAPWSATRVAKKN
jgi:hypothetical protein